MSFFLGGRDVNIGSIGLWLLVTAVIFADIWVMIGTDCDVIFFFAQKNLSTKKKTKKSVLKTFLIEENKKICFYKLKKKKPKEKILLFLFLFILHL